MVYSSAPLYLDPHNWHHHQQQQAQLHQQQQQQLHQQQNQQLSVTTHGGGGGENPLHQQITVQMQPPAPSQAVGGGSSSSIRPGSMADRARQAKIPQPEPGLKCPRCESTNTKFCYFNNYSLTQPRHFCKMCRRYWTRGGALRNVPVGGGCRRNKRSSSKSGGASKSAGEERQITGTGLNDNSTSPISSNSNNTEINNNSHVNNMMDTSLPGQSYVGTRMTQFPLLASLQGLTHGQYGSPSSNLGLNFNGMMHTSAQGELGFPIGASSGNSDQWRPHHYPNFLAGFDPPQVPHQPPPSSSLYQFPNDHHQNTNQQASNPPQSRSSISISTMNQQAPSADQIKNNEAAAAAVKPEGAASQGGGMNFLSRSFLGMSENSQYWVGNNNNNSNNTSTWTDLSGLNS